MTYKNGWKNYLLLGVCYGVPMGIFFGLAYGVALGLFGGILCGILFTGAMFLISLILERKFAKKREQIACEKTIRCDGPATLKGNGGWLFLTEQGLEFYAHKFNLSSQCVNLPLNTVVAAKANKTQIVVSTADGMTYAFVVSKSTEWKKQLDAAMTAALRA